jgi:hypothetical protein
MSKVKNHDGLPVPSYVDPVKFQADTITVIKELQTEVGNFFDPLSAETKQIILYWLPIWLTIVQDTQYITDKINELNQQTGAKPPT